MTLWEIYKRLKQFDLDIELLQRTKQWEHPIAHELLGRIRTEIRAALSQIESYGAAHE